jgi:hypothetical protein
MTVSICFVASVSVPFIGTCCVIQVYNPNTVVIFELISFAARLKSLNTLLPPGIAKISRCFLPQSGHFIKNRCLLKRSCSQYSVVGVSIHEIDNESNTRGLQKYLTQPQWPAALSLVRIHPHNIIRIYYN